MEYTVSRAEIFLTWLLLTLPTEMLERDIHYVLVLEWMTNTGFRLSKYT